MRKSFICTKQKLLWWTASRRGKRVRSDSFWYDSPLLAEDWILLELSSAVCPLLWLPVGFPQQREIYKCTVSLKKLIELLCYNVIKLQRKTHALCWCLEILVYYFCYYLDRCPAFFNTIKVKFVHKSLPQSGVHFRQFSIHDNLVSQHRIIVSLLLIIAPVKC